MADQLAAGGVHDFAGEPGAPSPFPWEHGPRIHSIQELFAQKQEQWLVEGIMPLGGMGLVSSKPGQFKTFLMLGVALAVAAGRPWCGRPTHPGAVLYVSAEGRLGLARRVAAWCKHNGVEQVALDGRFLTIPSPVDVHDPDALDAVTAQIAQSGAQLVLIVIDTLARCMGGGDENSTRDMNQFIVGCDRLREPSGAAVWVVHHSRKNDDAPRGSSALEGAIDTHIQVKRRAATITVSCAKQKDAEAFEDFKLERVVVELKPAESGEPASSCVLVPKSAVGTKTGGVDDASSREHVRELHSVWDAGGTSGCTRAAAHAVAGGGRTSFYRIVSGLIAAGFVEEVPSGHRSLVRVSAAGKERLVPIVPNRPDSCGGTRRKARPKSQRSRPLRGRNSGTGTAAGAHAERAEARNGRGRSSARLLSRSTSGSDSDSAPQQGEQA